jgi:RNA polymerase-binding transcription factor DksA
MDLQVYKTKLEQEEARLELELTDIGRINPANPSDWSASADASEMNTADLNNLADTDEEQSTNSAIVDELEVRLKNVKDALKRIADGTYGTCTKCGTSIDSARLTANPAATVCTNCME